MIRALRLVAEAVLCVAILSHAAVVTHDFSKYADHYPYLALDDSLANVSYSLANEGRYGFMASPVQAFAGTARHHAFSNYGPWYFFAGAGLISLFGYSLVLMRGIHLLGILAIAATGLWWFGRRGSVVAGAVLGFGVLQAFEVSQWPMVRPDIFVSVFAVLFIVTAGVAIERRSTLAWAIACACAGCAALSHLIAWTLVPCAAMILIVSLANEGAGVRRSARLALAAAAGFLFAAFMFYGSFGFRVGDHVRLLLGYRQFLSQSSQAAAGYWSVLGGYLRGAFEYLPPATRWGLGASIVLALAMLAATLRQPVETRRRVLALLLPPVAVLLAYTLSLGTYANPHSGYVILVQVTAWWCAASVLAVLLSRVEARSAALETLARLAVAGVMITVVGARLTAKQPVSDHLERNGEWAGIRDYTDRVQQFIPDGATAWGSVFFGIENPDRLQLIQLADALSVVQAGRQQHAVSLTDVAPQFLVWGYPDRRDAVLAEMAPEATRQLSALRVVDTLLPDVAYRLAGIVTGPPYGVTRVYAGAATDVRLPAAMPVVQAYDPAAGVWDTRLEDPIDATITSTAPVAFAMGSTAALPAPADRSVALDLPTGRFLFRVHVRPAVNSSRRLLAVTQTRFFRESFGDLGPSIDVAPYFSHDTDAYLFHDHSGGPLYISQFDDGSGASIEGVDVYRIASTLPGGQLTHLTFWDMPPLARWVPFAPPDAGVHATMAGMALVVEGNGSRSGYQVQSPPVPAPRGSHVIARADFSGAGGVVCVGALNGNGSQWLRRDGRPSRDIRFVVDDTASFRLTFYNCNGSETGNVASRFSIARAQYAVDDLPAVDRLMSLLDATPLPKPVPPDFRLRAMPPGLALTASDLARVPAPLAEGDLVFRAPLATRAAGEWTLAGTASSGFSYALVLTPKLLFGRRHLFARGRVNAGGVTFGLQQKGTWVSQIDITTPGEFIVEIEAPRLGRYTAVVAHYITDPSLRTDVTISQLGWISR